MGICGACGYCGGLFLQTGRPDLAICTWLVAALVAASWMFGDVSQRDRRLPRLVAWIVCAVNGHYSPTSRPGWSWQACQTCRQTVWVFRRPT